MIFAKKYAKNREIFKFTRGVWGEVQFDTKTQVSPLPQKIAQNFIFNGSRLQKHVVS